MKIYCDKCHEDITAACNTNIENYLVGRVVCPKCHHEQKRYVSEADILLYFGILEVSYLCLTFLMVLVFNNFGISVVSVVILLLLLLLSWAGSGLLASSIYQKAFFKKEVMFTVFEEDRKAIQKNISWQFMMFFAIVITYLTVSEGKLFFGIAMPLAVALTFIKFFLQIRNEKNR